MNRLQELVRLHRMGTGAREVARLLGMSPNTERTYRVALDGAGLLVGAADEVPALDVLRAAVEQALPTTAPPQMISAVDMLRDQIEALAKKGLTAKAIHDRLRLAEPGLTASYWSVRAAWRKWRKARGVRAEDVAIPVETGPGEVAQVDFGYVGKLYDATCGRLRKAWAFVMVLAYSRMMVVRICFDQKIETWLRVHVEAFAELGGAPMTIVPDNLKAAVVRAAFGVDGAASLNRSYRELAQHYGIKIDPAPIYAPKKKGKVESGVKYTKRNFFTGRDGDEVAATTRELARWVAEIANVRTHGTTRRQPVELFVDERAALRPIPGHCFELVTWRQVRVHQDSHVAFDNRLYSVPWRLIGEQLWLRATSSMIVVYAHDVRVAMHDRRGRAVRSTCDEHLPTERAPWRHRSRDYWEARADQIAPEVGVHVRAIFDSDAVLSMLRTVQSVVTHLEKFPVERSIAACRRAARFGNYTYGALKNILRDGLDLQPSPTASSGGALATPRFARPIGELLHHHEVGHERN